MYVKPQENIPFGESDPRWIGAWWIGPPCIGALTLVFTVIVAFFPRRLPHTGSQMTDAVAKGMQAEDRCHWFPAKEITFKAKQ